MKTSISTNGADLNPVYALPDGNGALMPFSELMTEKELIVFLRIPEISKAKDYGSVIDNLKRIHDLPCIHIARKPLYPLSAIRRWIDEKLEKEQGR